MGTVYNHDTDRLDYVANVDDGTAAGQLAFWDESNWTPAETTELVWDDTNKRLGIGVSAPGEMLSLKSTDTSDLEIRICHDNAVGDPAIRFDTNYTNWIMGVDNDDGDKFKVSRSDQLGTTDRLVVDGTGNIGFGTTSFGTSAATTVAFINGTAPSADVANQHAYYSADFAVGNACPYFRTENGTTIGLNQSLLTTDGPTFAGATMNGDVAMGGSYQVTGLQAPAAAGETIRQTTNITETNLETLVGTGDADALHTHNAKANLAGPTFSGTVTVPSTNFTIGSTTFSETQLGDLTDGGDTTAHDHDGIAENTAARHSNASDHTQGTDTTLGTMGADIDMNNSYQVVNLQAPAAAGEALRQTTNITETDLEQLTDGSDTTLHDHDGISENTSARHTQGTDTALGTMTQDIDMDGSYQVVGLQAPDASGQAIRATAKITEAKMEAADDHVAATGNQHGHDTHDHSTALGTGIASDLSDITSAGADIEDAVTKKHVAITLNASATTGGMSLSTQEISNRAASNAQTGYATAAQITAIEANTTHAGDNSQAHTDYLLNSGADAVGGDLDFGNSYQVINLQAPAANGEAIRATAKITEAKMEAADDHVAATGNQHGHDTHDHTTALGTAAVADLGDTTATGAELNTLTDNSMGDALHRHSELSASDGTPDATVQVDASGNVGVGVAAPNHLVELVSAAAAQFGLTRDDASIAAGNGLGQIYFNGTHGGQQSGARIRGDADGTWATDDSPGMLKFETTPAGSATLAVRMTIKSDGKVGIGDPTPSTILDVVADSATDPVADAWDTHCGRHNQVDLGEAFESRLGAFKQIKLYNYARKVKVSDEEVVRELINEWGSEPQIGFEDKRMQLEVAKAQLPKFATGRVGIMIDDSNVPSEILTFDEDGNKTGISGNGYIGYLHKVIKDQQVMIDGFEERIVALEREQG